MYVPLEEYFFKLGEKTTWNATNRMWMTNFINAVSSIG